MRFVERQSCLEQRIYCAIDELEDVFEVEIPFYPEVKWLGRKGHFEDLGLPEYYREEVEELQKYGRSVYVDRAHLIILNGYESVHINEESSHCVHFNASHINLIKRAPEEWLLVNSIVEMFGFLGSLFLEPRRKNEFFGRPDYFKIAFDAKVSFENAVRKLGMLPEKFENEFIYTQGYDLGERVFYALYTGQIKMGYIQKLFNKNFSGKGEVTLAFKDLRRKVWPIR
jgi:hypothetical protein